MAIVKDGVMGPFRNKVGTVVGRKFRGLDVMTGLYEKKTNRAPSEAKLRQQARFGMLSAFLYAAADLVEPGFKRLVKAGQSPVNAAYKFNFPHAFVEGMEEAAPDTGEITDAVGMTGAESAIAPATVYHIGLNFPKLVYSRGAVERANCPSVALAAPDKILISWLPQAENVYSRYGDKASFLLYNVEKKMTIVLRDQVLRGNLSYEYELHETLQGDTFHCWMSFNNESGKLAGDSVYVGKIQE